MTPGMTTQTQAPGTANSPNGQYDPTLDSDLFKKPDIAALNNYYLDGDTCDQDIFAEMRSNVLLVGGEHYNRRQSNFYRRIRDSKELSQEQKLRLTKNHVQKICKLYANNIVSMNPGVGFSPKDETSMHDQKVTELHHSVWQDAVQRYDIDDKIDDWCDSYIQIGEVHTKIFWDPSMGKLKGYEAQIDPQTGSPLLNDFQEPMPDQNKPVMEGEFVFEDVYGFNLLRPPECKNLKKAEWLGIRKMTDTAELKRKFKGQDDILKFIQVNQDETYVIFDMIRSGYKKTNKQTMIREYYFRPSMLFPNGYFYITTKAGILAEGELPGGLFPIVSQCFDKIQTTPRGRSPVKTMRPYQAEINRAASKMAEHQITLGDDKLLIQNGTKLSAGGSLPGVRGVNYSGAKPEILAGRDGSQYLQYMQSQIAELYQVMMVEEDSAMSDNKLDPYALLYASGSKKKKFQRNIKGFEKFLIQVVHLYLRLAKIHMPDDAVVMAVGKNEQVNIPEFRSLPDTCYEVDIEAQADDIETKLGQQISMNHALQYVGAQLKPDEIGKILKQMPFLNVKGAFDDLTIDEDSAENDMLALDRGEAPPIHPADNHPYMIKKLTNRTRKADFQLLTPQVQGAYTAKINMHTQMEAANQAAIQRAEAGFIPNGGYLVTCQLYVKDPSDATGLKTRLARVPYQALEWLIQQLETQGASQASYAGMNSGTEAQMANEVSQQSIPRPGMSGPPGAPQGAPPGGPPKMQQPMAMPSMTPHPSPPMAMGAR